MQELRAQRDFSVSKQRPTQSRSVGPSISDAVGAHRFPTDWRLTARRVGREERVSLMRSRNGAADSLWVWAAVRPRRAEGPQHRSERTLPLPDWMFPHVLVGRLASSQGRPAFDRTHRMLVEVPVSSMKTRRSGSNLDCSSAQACLARAKPSKRSAQGCFTCPLTRPTSIRSSSSSPNSKRYYERPPSARSKAFGTASQLCSTHSHLKNAPTISAMLDMLHEKWKLL
jgi:hypothetical protein